MCVWVCVVHLRKPRWPQKWESCISFVSAKKLAVEIRAFRINLIIEKTELLLLKTAQTELENVAKLRVINVTATMDRHLHRMYPPSNVRHASTVRWFHSSNDENNGDNAILYESQAMILQKHKRKNNSNITRCNLIFKIRHFQLI